MEHVDQNDDIGGILRKLEKNYKFSLQWQWSINPTRNNCRIYKNIIQNGFYRATT